MNSLFLFFIFCFGAIVGSFLNVIILRLPVGEGLDGRSLCPSCKHILGVLDLVPLLSFVFLGGRCRYCRSGISPRYFFIEAATGLLFASAAAILRPELSVLSLLILLKWLIIISVCMVTFVVDFEHLIILFYVIVPPAVLVLFLDAALDVFYRRPLWSLSSWLLSGLVGAFLSALPFAVLWYSSKWWQNEPGKWMGFGDVELAACLGAMLGWPLAGVAIFLAIVLGGAVSVLLLAFGKKTLKSQIPFGTFLSFAAVVSLFYGEKMLRWYLAIIGF